MTSIISFGGQSYEVEDLGQIFGTDEEEEITDDYFKCWVVGEDKSMMASKAINTLPPGSMKSGVWEIMKTQNGYAARPQELNNENIIMLPNQEIAHVTQELSNFWQKADLFKEHGITHKRGVLLHGPPGTGKSSIIDLIAKECVAQDGLVFYIRERNDLMAFIEFAHYDLKQLEGDRKILTIIEDIDNIAQQDMSTLLAFLDGEDEVEHNVVLATTNHIKELSDILTRQSRFDYIIEINHPTVEDRKEFLKGKYKFEEGEKLDMWVKDTNDQSLAALNELFIAVELLGNPYDEALSRMKDHTKLVSKGLYKSKNSKDTVGFKFGK